jgi:O-antigen/teichoic acid export membrane protein
MSVSARLISGSLASWVQIGVTMISQIVLVPLYLSYWNVETYGIWLAIVAFTGILNSLDTGFQEYLAYEFLKMGKADQRSISKHLSSGLLIGLGLGLFQILIVLALFASGLMNVLFDDSSLVVHTKMLEDVGIVLVAQGLAWLVFGSIGGILGRGLHVFGYFPRMAWWSVFASTAINLAPAVAVWMGADLLYTGVAMAAVRFFTSLPICADMLILYKRVGIRFRFPSFKIGWNDFVKSLYVCFAGLLDNIRNQGARMLLTPLAGVGGLAAFSTMRTGSNVAMQGLHTITHPLMPDLISFLHKKDQMRSDVAFVTIWVVAVIALCPTLIIVQLLVEPLYLIWTKNQIAFNPWLFATLSMGILVYALSQPAIAVVRGNNLLKSQVIISGVAGVATIIGTFVFVPSFGITGAGLALLLAEIIANIYYTITAKRWLIDNEMLWPKKLSSIAITSICISAIAMMMLILSPQMKFVTTAISLLALVGNTIRFWLNLPEAAKIRIKDIVVGLPGLKFLFS